VRPSPLRWRALEERTNIPPRGAKKRALRERSELRTQSLM